MKRQHQDIESEKLDQLLDQLKGRTAPVVPSDLEDRVLSRIRVNDGPMATSQGLVFSSFATLRVIALVAFLGLGSGLLIGSALADRSNLNERSNTREALSLNFFSAESALLHIEAPNG